MEIFFQSHLQGIRGLFSFYHRRYNKQMQQLLYEPMCQLVCIAPSGSETQLQISN